MFVKNDIFASDIKNYGIYICSAQLKLKEFTI